MCLIAIARNVHPQYPLVVAANRDEFLDRPTVHLKPWATADLAAAVRSTSITLTTSDNVIAGKDLTAGGTWLAVAKGGRFGAVTNVRDPQSGPAPLSRGELPLLGVDDNVPTHLDDYGPGNLLWGTADELHFLTNRGDFGRSPEQVGEGVHSLSNASLDTPWPKSLRAAADLEVVLRDWSGPTYQWLDNAPGDPAVTIDDQQSVPQSSADFTVSPLAATPQWAAQLLDPLLSRERAQLNELPDTGVGIVREWFLSSPFVRTAGYGTRSQTAVAMDVHGEISIVERRFDAGGALIECNGAIVK